MRQTFITLLLILSALPLSTRAQYKMAGPYEVVARDGQYRSSKGGSERDMLTAYLLAAKAIDKKALTDFDTYYIRKKQEPKEIATLTRDEAQAAALAIINAYATTLRQIDGHDAPLCTIQGFDLVRAMTLLRAHRTQAWDDMVRRVWLPVCDRFEAASPYANGNWGAIVNRMRMASGIYLQDSTVYRASIDYFYHANDNGSLPRYISSTGQCQETGRDQGHAQLGLEAIADACELAWTQGDDLWGALDNRLMKGFEYTARYNLGYDVPFTQWTDCTGLYNDWAVPSEFNRGRLWDIYAMPYHHYVERRHLKMPYTKIAIDVLNGKNKHNVKGDKRKQNVKESERVHQAWTYPAPNGAPMNDDYDVYIKSRSDKEYRRIDTYMARVNAPLDGGKHGIREVSYCQFDFVGGVDIRVVCRKRKFTTARIRPDYRGVICDVLNDSTIHCYFFQPENVSVEFDGDITNNLHIFSSRPTLSREEAERQAKADGRQFIYIPAGYYAHTADVTSLPAGTYEGMETILVPSNTTIYMAPGSYINGTLAVDDAENVTLMGRGICRPTKGYEGCHVRRSRNVLIDGLILNTCPVGESDGVTLRDVKSISHPSWGDGLNVFASQNVTYDRVFCRNSDDCTTVYATRMGYNGNARNVTMRNSTLWADVAHPIFIGIHGNAERGDTIENIRYENIDILCQAEAQIDYQGCMAINCGDNNLVRNVTFDNIRIEGIRQGSICQVKVGYNAKYCAAPGRSVEDITFRNIRYYGPEPQMSLILGYDGSRTVHNVTFEGLKINGRPIYDGMPGKPGWYKTADMMGLYVNDHVKGLTFKK